jgi:hypothetical protein
LLMDAGSLSLCQQAEAMSWFLSELRRGAVGKNSAREPVISAELDQWQRSWAALSQNDRGRAADQVLDEVWKKSLFCGNPALP